MISSTAVPAHDLLTGITTMPWNTDVDTRTPGHQDLWYDTIPHETAAVDAD